MGERVHPSSQDANRLVLNIRIISWATSVLRIALGSHSQFLSDFQDIDFRRSFSTKFDAYHVCFKVPYGYETNVSDIGRYRINKQFVTSNKSVYQMMRGSDLLTWLFCRRGWRSVNRTDTGYGGARLWPLCPPSRSQPTSSNSTTVTAVLPS